MHGQSNLDRAKIIINVPDIGHVISALADLANNRNAMRANQVDIEIHVAPGLSGDFVNALTDIAKKMEALEQ